MHVVTFRMREYIRKKRCEISLMGVKTEQKKQWIWKDEELSVRWDVLRGIETNEEEEVMMKESSNNNLH